MLQGSVDVYSSRENMLQAFVEHVPILYGEDFLIYNVRSLIHLADDVMNMKCTLNEISVPFESYLDRMIKLIHTPYKPLAQIGKRLSEQSVINDF